MGKDIYISDTLHGLIRLSDFEKRIISSPGFNRLHDIYQNSTVYLTFPSNRTKRFEHSIGTMKLCSDMFFCSILNTSDETIIKFFSLYDEHVKKALHCIKSEDYDTFNAGIPRTIPNIKLNDHRRALLPANVPEEFKLLHILLIESIRVAALLHDIGHPPFSHVVERAMIHAYEKSKENSGDRWKHFREKMERYCDKGHKLHEVMGDEISRSILKGIIARDLPGENRTKDERRFELCVLEIVRHIYSEDYGFAELHRIIDGSVDGDRLDYVTRDPLNSGMKSGSVDYERIINGMEILFEPVRDEEIPRFCIPVKAVNAVEDFLKRRYDLYKRIVNHHRVIKTDYLLEKSVGSLIEGYLNQAEPETEYDVDPVAIPYDISGLWFPLGNSTLEGKNCALSQWNDSWLMTILKQIYYTEYYDADNQKQFVTSSQLKELIANEKRYYSLIKRYEDFKIVDNAIEKILSRKATEIGDNISKIREKSQKHLVEENFSGYPDVVEVDETYSLKYLEMLANIQVSKNEFVLPKIMRDVEAINLTTDDIKKEIDGIIGDICKEEFGDSYRHFVTVFKEISLGIGDYPIFFYDDNERLLYLNEISGITESLISENQHRPVFYLYVLLDSGISLSTKKKEDVLKKIGVRIGEYMLISISNLINEQVEIINAII